MNEIFEKHGFPQGRMISGSKSGYRQRFPKNDVIFNARIFTKTDNWHGDLDITKDRKELQKLCNEINEEMLITSESVGWHSENQKYEDIEENAHAKFIPNSQLYYSRVYNGYHSLQNGNMFIFTGKGIDWEEININNL